MEKQAKIIEISIKSYKARLNAAKKDAVLAISEGLFETAARKVAEASKYQGCIEELEYQLENIEVA